MNRRSARTGATVSHQHRVGPAEPVAMVSELTYVRGEPKAILGWIDMGNVRTPICVDLDPAKLTVASNGPCIYGDTTVDPRADDLGPAGGRIDAGPTPTPNR